MPCTLAVPCGGVSREDPISSQVAGRPIRRCLNGHRLEAPPGSLDAGRGSLDSGLALRVEGPPSDTKPLDAPEEATMAKDPATCGFCRLSKSGKCVRHGGHLQGPSGGDLASRRDLTTALPEAPPGALPERPPSLTDAIWKLLGRRRDLEKELAEVDGELTQLRTAIDEALHPGPEPTRARPKAKRR